MKSNDEFITDVVDSNEFYDYVDFIDNSQITFNDTEKILHFSDFIKAHGRNKNVKPILFNENLTIEQTINNEQETSEINQNKQKSTSTSENQNFKNNLIYPFLEFINLSNCFFETI